MSTLIGLFCQRDLLDAGIEIESLIAAHLETGETLTQLDLPRPIWVLTTGDMTIVDHAEAFESKDLTSKAEVEIDASRLPTPDEIKGAVSTLLHLPAHTLHPVLELLYRHLTLLSAEPTSLH